MDRVERRKLVEKGVMVLRPQYDVRKNSWKIVQATSAGGWAHFGKGLYINKNDADRIINDIVTHLPQIYKADI